MAFDAHSNLAISSVVTPPSPPGTGLSLIVATGEGARFPAAPFNVTVWPGSQLPTPANAEILRVISRTVDTFSFSARAQEGTTARAIAAGDLIAATVTAKTLTDLEQRAALKDEANTFTQTQQISLDLLLTRYLYEKARPNPMGHWINVPFSAANFSANPMTWTVSAGNVLGNKYTLIGNTLIWAVYIYNSTLSGSVANTLYINYPGGLTLASGRIAAPTGYLTDGTGVTEFAGWTDNFYPAQLRILKVGSANYALGAGVSVSFTVSLALA